MTQQLNFGMFKRVSVPALLKNTVAESIVLNFILMADFLQAAEAMALFDYGMFNTKHVFLYQADILEFVQSLLAKMVRS